MISILKKTQDKIKQQDSKRSSKPRLEDDSTSKILSNKVDSQQFEQLQKEFFKLQNQVKTLNESRFNQKEPGDQIDTVNKPSTASATIQKQSDQPTSAKKHSSTSNNSEVLDLLNLHGFKEKDLVQAVKSWKKLSELVNDNNKRGDRTNPQSEKEEELEHESGEKGEKPIDVDVSNFIKAEKDDEEPQNLLDEEFKVLTLIELLLAESKVLEAMKVIKWRKKIIRIANMNGWDVARIVATNTIKKLGNSTWSFKALTHRY